MSKFGVWQPIETAPRTSKAILVWTPQNLCTFAVSWDTYENAWVHFGGGITQKLNQSPTHWMPLPPAPGEQVGEMVGWISEKDLASLKAKTVWRPLLSTFKPKNDGEVLLYAAPPSTSALVEALEAIDRLDPHNDSTSEWNHAFGLVKAALAAHRKETA